MKRSLLLLLALCVPASADIYRWDNGEVIPGTEGIDPGRGVILSGKQLQFANLRSFDLTGAYFDGANLADANFSESTLKEIDMSGATLTGATMKHVKDWTHAKLDGAEISGADMTNATVWWFTKEQLYATKSYQERDLRGIKWSGSTLIGYDLTGQDMTGSDLSGVHFENVNLSNANLTNANMRGPWEAEYANFTGSNISGATLPETITKEQIYSTANWQNKDLRNVTFTSSVAHRSGYEMVGADLRGIDFRGAVFERMDSCRSPAVTFQGFYQANFSGADLTGVSFAGVCTTGAVFSGAKGYVPVGFTRPPGDSNNDGWFNSSDLVTVFAAGQYEDAEIGNSTFDTGDWNGDGDFNSGDLVTAFSIGAYEPQNAPAAVAVPEPTGVFAWISKLLAFLGLTNWKRKWRS